MAASIINAGPSDGFVFPPVSSGGGLSDGSYGDIAVSGGGTVMDIAAGAVGNTELRNGAACSVVGRSATTVGALADIAAAANDRYLARSANALSFKQIAASEVSGLSDAATTSVADIITAVIAFIDANYGGLLAAAASVSTKGDLIVWDGSAWAIKPIGADGRVLTANSTEDTGLEWA